MNVYGVLRWFAGAGIGERHDEAGTIEAVGTLDHRTWRRAHRPVGTELKIAFGNPPQLPMIRASGIIKRQHEGKEVGVAFTDISASDPEAIRGFIADPVNMAQEES